jgi:hypothetical protein
VHRHRLSCCFASSGRNRQLGPHPARAGIQNSELSRSAFDPVCRRDDHVAVRERVRPPGLLRSRSSSGGEGSGQHSFLLASGRSCCRPLRLPPRRLHRRDEAPHSEDVDRPRRVLNDEPEPAAVPAIEVVATRADRERRSAAAASARLEHVTAQRTAGHSPVLEILAYEGTVAAGEHAPRALELAGCGAGHASNSAEVMRKLRADG